MTTYFVSWVFTLVVTQSNISRTYFVSWVRTCVVTQSKKNVSRTYFVSWVRTFVVTQPNPTNQEHTLLAGLVLW